jgi:Cu(I)/Ag(I) efflux system membrane protein CusA/SilA
VERLPRFPINVRCPRDYRDSIGKLGEPPVVTGRGRRVRRRAGATSCGARVA